MKRAILAIALLGAPLAAQDTINIGKGSSRPEVAPMKIKPGIDIKASPIRPKVERKAVHDWPDADLTLAMPQDWSNPSRRIAANHPPSALAVERIGNPPSGRCLDFYDRIDLAAVRKRGFTLVGFSAEPLPPRFGHALEAPVEAIAVNSGEGDHYTAFLEKADQIRIRPPIFAKREGARTACWSGYRLTVTLEGPAGVDPFGFARPGRPRHR